MNFKDQRIENCMFTQIPKTLIDSNKLLKFKNRKSKILFPNIEFI